MIKIYADGSSRGNPGPAGFGVVAIKDNNILTIISKQYKCKTNNAMELSALLVALELAATKYKEEKCKIYCDSMYCVNIFNNWIENWKINNWTRGRLKEEIKNLDLVKKIYKYKTISFPNFLVEHCKGHNDILGNEIADAAATNNEEKLAKIFRENNISIMQENII